ncbi:Hypothetical predicted protein [Pelobates cultripes]|uniref:Uncharacterized protein n=1 Tax=Pelobates cultripes TaxID=61616 RepID=A0AAD1TBD5_PELCU|nr:Hypothetical predicted protein [Pelobates cultripes]
MDTGEVQLSLERTKRSRATHTSFPVTLKEERLSRKEHNADDAREDDYESGTEREHTHHTTNDGLGESYILGLWEV